MINVSPLSLLTNPTLAVVSVPQFVKFVHGDAVPNRPMMILICLATIYNSLFVLLEVFSVVIFLAFLTEGLPAIRLSLVDMEFFYWLALTTFAAYFHAYIVTDSEIFSKSEFIT